MRQRREMRQEVGDRAAGELERGVRRVGVGEAAGPEDIEADEHLDMGHRPELARLDAPENLLRRTVEEVVVILDEMAPWFLGAPNQRLQLLEGGRRRLFHDDVGPGVERVQRRAEVGGRRRGDVDDVGPRLLQHDPMVGEP